MERHCAIPLTPESLEQFAPRCGPIRERILPLLAELDRLETKGFRKTAEDIIQIKKLRGDVSGELAKIIAGLEILGAQFVISPTAGVPTGPEGNSHENFIGLSNLNTDGETFATADANMFFTQWSPDFVHGSDSMLHITALAEKILRKGERLSKLTGITWRRPMRHNLKLAVYAEKFTELADRDRYVLEGGFETSDGRKLTVLGMDNPDSQITHRATNNPYAENTLCSCPACCVIKKDGTYSFLIHEPRTNSYLQHFAASQQLSVATMIEMLTLALSLAGNDEQQSDQQVLRVLGGLQNLPIPQNMASIFDGGSRLQVRLLKRQKRNGRSGMTLIPFQYKFPHQQDFSDGIAASTTSVDLARCF